MGCTIYGVWSPCKPLQVVYPVRLSLFRGVHENRLQRNGARLKKRADSWHVACKPCKSGVCFCGPNKHGLSEGIWFERPHGAALFAKRRSTLVVNYGCYFS
jgi:hypothetical protein